jgi:hypothetical protein
MRIFTVHTPLPAAGVRPVDAYAPAAAAAGDAPRGRVALVPEGFSLVAALAPAVWMLWHRLWIALALLVALSVLGAWLLPSAIFPWVLIAVQLAMGFQAQDIRRWTLGRQGLREVAVVAGRDEEAALLRLLAARPDLAEGLRA